MAIIPNSDSATTDNNIITPNNGIYVIGVDIGGTHISSAVVDIRQKKILDHTYATSHVANLEPYDVIMETWANTLNKTINASHNLDVQGIGFAIPGPFNYKKGIALYPEGFKYGALNEVKVEQDLTPLLMTSKCLPIRFMNDATSFAVGEAWLAEEEGFKRQLCITLGTGLGAGFIENGIPVVNGSTVPPNGCLWNVPYKDGMADDYFSTRGCINAYHERTGYTATGVKELTMLFKSDPRAKQMFEAFGKDLGDFLSPWIKKFGADALVMGGNISKSYACFGHALQSSLNENGISIPIRISNHMEKGAIIGGARVFDNHFWKNVKHNLPEL
ncbi:ROK family protein [Flagellimonas myxillae]|uniref:ROK family protein n=1 Tax=Flagellimonas myxillae TaxID=2942214 RepID=UPI00201F54AE|nr:ROK family protein [Muricauda myxillae]MCL6267073.1 ROK family protein [Muricauda myxillae]